MNILRFAEQLNLSLLVDSTKEINIEGVYIGDLLSIVMSKAKQNYTNPHQHSRRCRAAGSFMHHRSRRHGS